MLIMPVAAPRCDRIYGCGHLLRRGKQRVGDLGALGRPETDRVEVSVDGPELAVDALEERQYDLRGRGAV